MSHTPKMTYKSKSILERTKQDTVKEEQATRKVKPVPFNLEFTVLFLLELLLTELRYASDCGEKVRITSNLKKLQTEISACNLT